MITDARSLWELIERRVAETPDTTMLVDEDLRTVTYREYGAAAERAAAGLAELGVGEGTPVSWALPTWIESLVLVGALSRLGAVQNPILPIYRHREVGFVAKQTGAKLLIVPSTWKGFDYEGMAREIAAAQPGLDVLVVDRKLPAADATIVARRRAGAVGVLHVGDDRRPEGRPAHRPHDHGVGVRHDEGACDRTG